MFRVKDFWFRRAYDPMSFSGIIGIQGLGCRILDNQQVKPENKAESGFLCGSIFVVLRL